tara:strand:+ start:385 stop:1152 length:768 start_codon:yes stop_codon:yes gene_type:complete
MLESVTRQIQEVTLLLEDASIKGVNVKDDTVDIFCIAKRDAGEMHVNVSFSKTQLETIQRHLLSPEQIKAMHARKSAVDQLIEESQKTLEQTKNQLPNVEKQEVVRPKSQSVQAAKPLKKPEPEVIKLPREDADPLHWKDINSKNSNPRLSDEELGRLMYKVFAWYRQHRHYARTKRKYPTFEKYIHDVLPEQFGITTSTAKAYYSAKTRYEVTSIYETQWKNFIKTMARNSILRQVPRYLLQRWGGLNGVSTNK